MNCQRCGTPDPDWGWKTQAVAEYWCVKCCDELFRLGRLVEAMKSGYCLVRTDGRGDEKADAWGVLHHLNPVVLMSPTDNEGIGATPLDALRQARNGRA